MAGLVPAISLRDAPCLPKRDRRVKPGDDTLNLRLARVPSDVCLHLANAPPPVFFAAPGTP